MANNTSFYQFIHAYMFRHQLQVITMPFINGDIGEVIHCTNMGDFDFHIKNTSLTYKTV
jgi:hypothetical protein